MSLHNAITRRRTPNSRKRREHHRKGRKSIRWGKGRLKKWTRFKQRVSRRERRAAKRQLQLLRQFRDADADTAGFKQVRPKRRHLLSSLRPDDIQDKVRKFRHRMRTRKAAMKAALRLLDG